jgi:hypothetical protein
MCSQEAFWPIFTYGIGDSEAAAMLNETAGIDISRQTVRNTRKRLNPPNLDSIILMRFQFLHEIIASNGKLRIFTDGASLMHYDKFYVECRID